MPIIEISSLTHPGVDVFCMLTEAQLRQRIEPVSYTHLDVYKRQESAWRSQG